jgi:hypothetical protein
LKARLAAKKAGVPFVQEEKGLKLPGTNEPLPSGGERLWMLFFDLSNARGQGFSGPEAISWGDIDAYDRMTGADIERWEAAALRRMDDAYLSECATLSEARRDKSGKGGGHG